MNFKRIQPAKILIITYCVSLISLAVRDFGYILYEQPYFYVNFLAPLIILVLTITLYILKRKNKLFYSALDVKELSISELVGMVLLECVYIFTLVMVWHSVFNYTKLEIIVYSLFAAISNFMFLVYLSIWIANNIREKQFSFDTTRRQTTAVQKGKTKKIDFAKITELLGFSPEIEYNQIDDGYLFNVPKEHIYADVFERIKITYDNYFRAFRIVVKLKSDSLLSLDIQKRDSLFKNTRNEFSISPLSNVYTLNSQTPEIWEPLLSDPIFQQNLLLLRPYFEHFSLKGEYIEALVYSDTAIVKLLDWIMELNPSMEKISKDIESAESVILLCYNCQDPFDPLEEKCTKCGSPRPRCIICFQDLRPEEEDDVIQLPCCGIYVHRDHLLTWLQKKSICPNCHNSLTRWMNQLRIRRGF